MTNSTVSFFQSIRDFVEKRRAVRVQSPDVDAEIHLLGSESKKALKVEDLSTSGIGLLLDFMPSEPVVTIKLRHKGVLNNFSAPAEVRHVRKIESQDGAHRFFAGCEFQFESKEHSKPLYRWLADRIEQEKKEEEEKTPADSQRTKTRRTRSSIQPGIAVTKNDFEQALSLINPREKKLAKQDTKFFVAFHRENIATVLPLILAENAGGLIHEEPFETPLRKIRESGRKIGEVSVPFFNQTWVDNVDPRMAPMKKLDTLFSAFTLTVLYAIDHSPLTDLVTLCPPHLEEFYRMWLFSDLSEDEIIRGKGFRVLRLGLGDFEKRAAEERPEILSNLEKQRASFPFGKALTDLYKPDEEFLNKWFKDS